MIFPGARWNLADCGTNKEIKKERLTPLWGLASASASLPSISSSRSPSAASGQRGNNLTYLEDVHVNAKAKIWHCLAYMCHIRSTRAGSRYLLALVCPTSRRIPASASTNDLKQAIRSYSGGFTLDSSTSSWVHG